jgi:hypothetical protein
MMRHDRFLCIEMHLALPLYHSTVTVDYRACTSNSLTSRHSFSTHSIPMKGVAFTTTTV